MIISADQPRVLQESGGIADVFKSEYESSQVAIKVIRTYITFGLTEAARVNRFLGSCLGIPYLHWMPYRISAEKLLFGDTYGTPTSYACAV